MATTGGRNQGKTPFVQEVLKSNPLANARAVNDAWRKAGNDGKISETLVNKMRSQMGLAGNLRGKRRARVERSTAGERPTYTGKKRGRKPKNVSMPDAQGSQSNGRQVESARPKTGARRHQLVELETEIDKLLFRVMNLGELPEIEESLRQARRLLYGGFSGQGQSS